MCILLYPATPQTNYLISYVTYYPVSLPQFLFPFHSSLSNMVYKKSKNQEDTNSSLF